MLSSYRTRRLVACVGLSLLLSFLASPAGAVDLFAFCRTTEPAQAEAAAPAAPQVGLLNALWDFLTAFITPPPPPPTTTDDYRYSRDDGDHGVTLDPNG